MEARPRHPHTDCLWAVGIAIEAAAAARPAGYTRKRGRMYVAGWRGRQSEPAFAALVRTLPRGRVGAGMGDLIFVRADGDDDRANAACARLLLLKFYPPVSPRPQRPSPGRPPARGAGVGVV